MLVDGQFTHRPVVWHPSTPRAVAYAQSWGDDSLGWRAWVKHLRKRKSPRSLQETLGLKRSALGWGLTTEPLLAYRPALDRIARLARRPDDAEFDVQGELRIYLAEHREASYQPHQALLALAWADALPALARFVMAHDWWELLNHLLRRAHTAASAQRPAQTQPEYDLAQQLLGGELPFLLAHLFPEIDNCRPLAAAARFTFSHGLDRLLDSQGQVSARHLPVMRPLLASWTRAHVLGAELEGACCDETALSQLRAFVQQVLRCTRPDGARVLAPADAPRLDRSLFQAVLAQVADRPTRQLATPVLPKDHRSDKAPRPPKRLPTPSSIHASGKLAVLRTDWTRRATVATVHFADALVQWELALGQELLWSGEWSLDVRCNGQPLALVGPWELKLGQLSEHADHLLIEAPLSEHVRVQRQIVLARKEHFLFFADALLGEQPASLGLRSSLTLAPTTTIQPAMETREVRLRSRRASAWVFPLALPEWRRDRRIGELSDASTTLGAQSAEVPAASHLLIGPSAAPGSDLVLSQQAHGKSLYAPWFVDLAPSRQEQPATWRQLTVCAQRQVVPPDVAVGYRMQVDTRQWLVYRSLGRCDNRTVLGQNFVADFVLARFRRNGTIDALVGPDQ